MHNDYSDINRRWMLLKEKLIEYTTLKLYISSILS